MAKVQTDPNEERADQNLKTLRNKIKIDQT